MIKLIASDMDGTLLDESGNIPAEFFDVFKSFKKRNITFVAASGRQYHTLVRDLDSVKNDVIFIAENGSFVLHEDKELYSCPIDSKTVEELIDIGRKLEDSYTLVCGKKATYIESSDQRLVNEVKKYCESYRIVEDLKKVEDDVLKITICDFKGPVDNSNKIFYPLYKDKLRVVISGELFLDMMNIKASKGEAIKYLQDKLNISPNETMVFGDYFNDVEMLQSAYHSYAMENAPDGVKKHARFIAKSNREKGVILTIKSKVLA